MIITRKNSISGVNQIHSESELNAEFGFSCEFCLILLLACRIKWSDAPGRPVSHMDSPTIDKADKWTSLTEIKIRCFCKENHFTWIEGHRFSKRGIWERERDEVWGSDAVRCVTALSLILPDVWLIICGKCCGNSQMVFVFKLTGTVAWIPNLICFLIPGSWNWPLLTWNNVNFN